MQTFCPKSLVHARLGTTPVWRARTAEPCGEHHFVQPRVGRLCQLAVVGMFHPICSQGKSCLQSALCSFGLSRHLIYLIKRIHFLLPKEGIMQYMPGKKNKQQFYTNILSNHTWIIMALVALVSGKGKEEFNQLTCSSLQTGELRSWKPWILNNFVVFIVPYRT